ncbi:MAG TPA: type II CAAX endopeptidase family protein [Steroidobacteraceae bacterium]
MNNDNKTTTLATWIGTAIALLAIPLIVSVFRAVFAPSSATTVARELTMFAAAGLLIWVIRSRERQPLASVGLVPAAAGRVALWTLIGLIGCIVVLAIGLVAVHAFGLRFGSAPGAASTKYSLWVTLLVVIRAGIVEELFYRGYAIDRVTRLSGSRVLGIALPLIVFAGFHYTQGAGGVLIALLLGGVLSALYVWKRNLTVNVLVHFLIDFIPNVVLPLISPE